MCNTQREFAVYAFVDYHLAFRVTFPRIALLDVAVAMKNVCSRTGNRTRAAWVKTRNPSH